ncbi:ABC-type sugar transport system substrate-binding protein [Rhizobium sp. BK181]|uniref:substrate-binding domain-containing protein n=1 Tax=Rhizobium sp. BK181 TaxID=2587072 RepID=UPI001613763D|nr:substrate-binding domain-containing protein [Rhizobium sp. BK181]MBB3317584.1 ABC-type sugar transport system substrate-binding protein [Rhizobium sp. BK181]
MNILAKKLLTAGASLVIGLALATTSASAANKKIAVSVPYLGFPIFAYAMKAVKDEAAKIGGVDIIELDGQNSSPKQVADIENVQVQGVDGILISPIDVNALTATVQSAIDGGTPVINVDRRVENVKGLLAFVGADNVAGGEAAARWVMARFPDGARIVHLQGQPGSSPAIDRNRGVHNVLDPVKDKYPIVAEQTANFLRADGLTVTQNILQSLDSPPEVIIAANDDSALGAFEALEGLKLQDKVTVIGYDALAYGLDSIRQDRLDATVEMQFGEQFRHALRTMVANLDTKEAQQDRIFKPFVIDKTNLDKAEQAAESN